MRSKNIQRCFNRAADRYDGAANFQHRVGETLIELLAKNQPKVKRLVDVGAGTGATTERLLARFSNEAAYAVDFSEPMLKRCQARINGRNATCIAADFDEMPFPSGFFNLLFSNMTLQWSLNFKKTLREQKRCLAPGGVMAVSLLVQGTLQAQADSLKSNPFYSASDIHRCLVEEGMRVQTFSQQTYVHEYPSLRALMHFFKDTGANYLTHATGHRYLRAVERERLSLPVGEVLFHVLYFIANLP